MFYVDMGHFLFFLHFFSSFFCIFYVYCFCDSRYRKKKKKRNLLIGQPQGSLSGSRWFGVFICFNLKFTFSCGLPT